MLKPYFTDGTVTVYLGDCRTVLPDLDIRPDACVADPPYGSTSAAWDRWPTGWIAAVAAVLPASASLWCHGTARMFLDHVDEFRDAGWKYGQEALWLKRNGTGPGSRDRRTVVHEWAYHWYRGKWGESHHEWEREPSGSVDKSTRSQANGAAHRRPDRASVYVDDGFRQPRSVTWVIEAPSVRGRGRHQDEKPVAVEAELIRECTPPGGLVLDPSAGTGTVGEAAKLIGRRAVLIEQNETLCEGIAKRMQDCLPVHAG